MVASDTGGLRDFAVGALAPVGDYEQLGEAMLTILDLQETNYLTLRDRAHQKALEYSWVEIVEKRLQIYQSLRERRA